MHRRCIILFGREIVYAENSYLIFEVLFHFLEKISTNIVNSWGVTGDSLLEHGNLWWLVALLYNHDTDSRQLMCAVPKSNATVTSILEGTPSSRTQIASWDTSWCFPRYNPCVLGYIGQDAICVLVLLQEAVTFWMFSHAHNSNQQITVWCGLVSI